jgi:methionyl-tRNA synthetase
LDGYLSKKEPWKIVGRRGEHKSLELILYTAADALRALAVLLYPIAPQSAERLWAQLGSEGELAKQNPLDLEGDQLKPKTKVGKPEPIFPRLDKAATLAKLDELAEADRNRDKPVGALREPPRQASIVDHQLKEPKEALKLVQTDKTPEGTPTSASESPAPSPQHPAPGATAEGPKISIEDFAKVEMRTGEIKAAERIPGATKLLKLQVDIGTELRQVCAGIAEYYEPEKLVGMKVVIVVNLQPRKMRGVESNGMIVAAAIGDQGRPVLVTFNEDVPNGARLR